MAQNYPGSVTTKTHSGWLDFALGAGLPGFFFVSIGIFFAFKNLFKIKNEKSIPLIFFASFWMLGGIWILFWPGELSYREFIEHYFFLIILFGVATSNITNTQLNSP